MEIKDIYARMRELQLASSQVQFSTVWLGRSPRYYSQLLATRREPSVGALMGLANRLGRLAPALPLNIRQGLLDLKRAVDRHYERREIVAVRRHRRKF
jgi:hypothetical protein